MRTVTAGARPTGAHLAELRWAEGPLRVAQKSVRHWHRTLQVGRSQQEPGRKLEPGSAEPRFAEWGPGSEPIYMGSPRRATECSLGVRFDKLEPSTILERWGQHRLQVGIA